MMASTPWYVGRDGKQLGPYRFEALRLAAARGKLRADDLVWTDGMTDWSRADAIADLTAVLPGIVAPSNPVITSTPVAAPISKNAMANGATESNVDYSHSNYLVRHWVGQFSLAHSYWINSVLIGMLWYGLAAAYQASGIGSRMGMKVAGISTLLFLLFPLVVSVWSFGGILHSADKHKSRGGRPVWAVVAKIMVVLGLLRMIGSVGETAPIFKESLILASGYDTVPASQLRVLNHATEVEIAGGLSFGTAESLRTVLDATPSVRLIQLNNTGGWITEGEKLGNLVRERKLATYTARECDSACLLVFMAGEKRYLGATAKLGFHQASVAGVGGAWAKEGTERMREAMAQKGRS